MNTTKGLDFLIQLVLIETYWNVNLSSARDSVVPLSVLIETYWNVNQDFFDKLNEEFNVLIETYWNVNLSVWRKPTQGKTRLNRNILECKCLFIN